MTVPRPRPTDVLVHHPDGTSELCELAYDGLTDEGMHRWVVAGEITRADRITIGVLPARTTIAVALREEH